MKKNVNHRIVNNIDIQWNLDESGKLTITGTGKIPDYACGNHSAAPWETVKDGILEVEISKGITEIGINAFRECQNLRKVLLPNTLWRIHAYAFWGCVQLKSIITERKDFKYVQDDRRYKENDTVIFGLQSFYKVPWCNERWGDFYCSDHVLYVCFSHTKNLVLPSGIRVLKRYSLAYLDVDKIYFPETLLEIEDYVFMKSKVKEKISLPDSIQTIDVWAFSESSIYKIGFPIAWRPHKIKWQRTKAKMLRRSPFPEYINQYSLGSFKNENLGKFRELQIIENKPVYHRNGDVTKIREGNYINIGKSLNHRMKHGSVVLCIRHENNKVLEVKSFIWLPDYGLLKEYLVLPHQTKEQILPWSDAYEYYEAYDVIDAFPYHDAEKLKNKGCLRARRFGINEEWFCTEDRGDFGGPLEIKLLELWVKEHPDMIVETVTEYLERNEHAGYVVI